MAIVWHGWVANIVGYTAIYNMVGATCVGVMLYVKRWQKCCFGPDRIENV